jgi:hypothetical protein
MELYCFLNKERPQMEYLENYFMKNLRLMQVENVVLGNFIYLLSKNTQVSLLSLVLALRVSFNDKFWVSHPLNTLNCLVMFNPVP